MIKNRKSRPWPRGGKYVLLAAVGLVLWAGCASRRVQNLADKKETVSVVNYHLETVINSPIEDVFALTKLWNTYTVDWAEYSTNSSHGLAGIGTVSTGRAKLASREVEWNEVVVDWEEGRRVKFVYSGDVRSSVQISMEPDGDKTIYRFDAHTFFLPDNVISSTLDQLLEQGVLGDYLDDAVTKFIKADIAQLEKITPEQVVLTSPPTHQVFVDAYYTAHETFSLPPERLFEHFDSANELARVLPVDRIEAVSGDPEQFKGMGEHYKMVVTEGQDEPLVYDMVVVQYDPPREERFYVYAYDVCMEMDLLAAPARGGSRLLMIFIMDMPSSVKGRTADVLIHLNDINDRVQKNLELMKNGLESK